MKMTVDFSDVQTRARIPAGDYQGVVNDCMYTDPKTGKEHGSLRWDVQIVEGEYEGRSPQAMYTSFSPDAKWKMMETFQNLLQTEEVNFELEFDDATGRLTSPEVIGLPCKVEIYNETYNNRMTSKISSILGPNQPTEAEEVAAQAAATATKPATKASPAAAAATSNGPAKRSPFPGGKAPGRTFKA